MATLLLHVDHTLMNTQSLFFLLGSFHPLETLELAQQPLPYDTNSPEWSDFVTRMEQAYHIFIKRVAQKELSRDPLCLFRPRTMEWLKEVNRKKKEGLIKTVILYTRSTYLRSCYFARDVIHVCLGISEKDDQLITEIIDGSYITNYEEKEDVYWIHHERIEEDQKENRIRVPFYDFVTSFDRLAELYFSSLREKNISQDAVEEVVTFLYGPKGSLKKVKNTLYDFFKERTGQTASNTSLPVYDLGWVTGQRWLERLEREEKWRKSYMLREKDI